MTVRRLVFLGCLLPAAAARPAEEVAPSADRPADPAPGSPADPAPVFYLRDGARVAGTPRLERLGVRTRYGLLEIPESDLVQVRFAPRATPGEMERILKAVEDLGADDLDLRERAMATLREAGPPARAALRRAARSPSAEVKSRAEILLSESAAQASEGEEDSGLAPLLDDEDDEVVTRRFTVRGQVLADRMVVESSYGRLELPASEIRGVLFSPESSVSRSVTVPASSTAPDAWVDTKLGVTRGLRLSIRARGSLTVPNYNVTAGPEGTRQYSGSTFGSFPMLSLIGKVGKNGKPFLVAREHEGRASREGTLYLAVVPFRRNYAAMGSFQARIETRP